MKSFQSAERDLEKFWGVIRGQYRLNRKIMIAFTCYWLDNILKCMFIVRDVGSFGELVNSLYEITITIIIATSFTIWIIQLGRLFRIINSIEEVTDRSKKIPYNKSI